MKGKIKLIGMYLALEELKGGSGIEVTGALKKNIEVNVLN